MIKGGKKVTYFNDYDAEIFDKLRDLRTQIATANNISPYIVFSDKTLKDLSVKLPQSKRFLTHEQSLVIEI